MNVQILKCGSGKMFPDMLCQSRQMKLKLSVLQTAADSSILRARQAVCVHSYLIGKHIFPP